MKEWFMSRITTDEYASSNKSFTAQLLDELNDIEADPDYTVQQVLYVNGQYQILYTKESK